MNIIIIKNNIIKKDSMIKKFDLIGDMEAYISSKIHGAFSSMDMVVLTDYVKKLQSEEIYLEIGVDYGKSAATAVFQAPEGVKFYFIDIVDREAHIDYPELLSRKQFFETEGLDTVGNFIQADANDIAKTWDKGKIALIFIDGNHSYEGCKADILSWLPHLKPGGAMLFHDYDISSPGVIQAVDELIKNSDQFQDFFVGKEKYQMATSIVGATKK
jgi:predicted O-methyltransferase YrrM